jgi:hypothetical protein
VKALIFLASVLLVAPALAAEKYVCKITANNPAVGTSTAPTAGTCSWVAGAQIRMQCSGAVFYAAEKDATTDDAEVATGDSYSIDLAPRERVVTFLPKAGAVTCRFFLDLR